MDTQTAQEVTPTKTRIRRRRSTGTSQSTSVPTLKPTVTASATTADLEAPDTTHLSKGGNPRIMPLKPEYTESDELFVKFIGPRFADLEDVYPTKDALMSAFERYQLLCGRSPQARSEQIIREIVEIRRNCPGLNVEYIIKRVKDLENLLS